MISLPSSLRASLSEILILSLIRSEELFISSVQEPIPHLWWLRTLSTMSNYTIEITCRRHCSLFLHSWFYFFDFLAVLFVGRWKWELLIWECLFDFSLLNDSFLLFSLLNHSSLLWLVTWSYSFSSCFLISLFKLVSLYACILTFISCACVLVNHEGRWISANSYFCSCDWCSSSSWLRSWTIRWIIIHHEPLSYNRLRHWWICILILLIIFTLIFIFNYRLCHFFSRLPILKRIYNMNCLWHIILISEIGLNEYSTLPYHTIVWSSTNYDWRHLSINKSVKHILSSWYITRWTK